MKPTGFLLLPGLLALGNCAAGPDYHAPAAPNVALTATPLPAATPAGAGVAQHFLSGADISGEWWELFHNPELNALVAAGLANNPTLAASQQTLLEAEENVRAGYGALFPSLSGSFQDERQRISAAELATQGGGTGGNVVIPPFTLYNASLTVSYDASVFGGAERTLEALQAASDYQRYELEAADLTLTANIVTAAITEASLAAQISATRQIIAIQQRELAILQAQATLGGTAYANVLSQQASLAQSQSTLPPLQLQLAQAQNQLATYAGTYPGNFHAADFQLSSLALPQDIPVSLPSAIVAQRPDIQAAAAQLHEASANLGIATANMLPSISLSASVGHDALTTAALFTPQTLLWSLAAGITQPIFEAGELSAKRKAALAQLRAASAQYQGVVLSAFQNVADALAALQDDAQTLAAAQAAQQAAARSLGVAEAQVQNGGGAFTLVLSAESTYQSAAITEVKAAAARLTDTAALFQALGGGWWHRNDLPPPCCGLVP